MTTREELQKAFNLTEDIARLKSQFPPEEIQAILDALNAASAAIEAFYQKRASTPGAVYLTQFLIRYYSMRAGSSAAALTLDTTTDPANVYAAVLQRVLTGMSVVAMETKAAGANTDDLMSFIQYMLEAHATATQIAAAIIQATDPTLPRKADGTPERQ